MDEHYIDDTFDEKPSDFKAKEQKQNFREFPWGLASGMVIVAMLGLGFGLREYRDSLAIKDAVRMATPITKVADYGGVVVGSEGGQYMVAHHPQSDTYRIGLQTSDNSIVIAGLTKDGKGVNGKPAGIYVSGFNGKSCVRSLVDGEVDYRRAFERECDLTKEDREKALLVYERQVERDF